MKFRVGQDKLNRLTKTRIAGSRSGQRDDRNLVSTCFASGLLVGEEHEATKTPMKSALKEFRRLRPLKVKAT